MREKPCTFTHMFLSLHFSKVLHTVPYLVPSFLNDIFLWAYLKCTRTITGTTLIVISGHKMSAYSYYHNNSRSPQNIEVNFDVEDNATQLFSVIFLWLTHQYKIITLSEDSFSFPLDNLRHFHVGCELMTAGSINE